MTRRILLLGAALLIAGILFWVAQRKNAPAPSRPEPQSEQWLEQPKNETSPTPSPTPMSTATPAQARRSREALLSRFKDRYGRDLQAAFAQDGRLASVKGRGPGLARAAGEFDSQSPQHLVSRAREILEAARELLGAGNELELEVTQVRPSASVAQVFLRQMHEGVPVHPFGSLTVQLGSDGQLLGLYSESVPDVDPVNSVKLSSAEAQDRAAKAVGSTARGEGGQHVLWVEQGLLPPGGTEVPAKHAYQFSFRGKEVVVDAQTGETLSIRDRRYF